MRIYPRKPKYKNLLMILLYFICIKIEIFSKKSIDKSLKNNKRKRKNKNFKKWLMNHKYLLVNYKKIHKKKLKSLKMY